MGLKPEISTFRFRKGPLRRRLLPGEPNSAGSEFLLVVTDQPQFTGQFTAFARIVEGIEIAGQDFRQRQSTISKSRSERIEIKDVTIRPRPVPVPPPFTVETTEELSQFRVVMETSKGNIVIEMLPDKAPNHVRHFLRLTSLGVYDKTAFHRIAAGLCHPSRRSQHPFANPSPQAAQKYVVKIRAEINDVKHKAGIVSMARGEEIDSALTSFFIVLADQPALDNTYTVFGRVVEGMDVVEKVAAMPNETNGRRNVWIFTR